MSKFNGLAKLKMIDYSIPNGSTQKIKKGTKITRIRAETRTDRNSTLALGLELVEHPSVLEGTLA